MHKADLVLGQWSVLGRCQTGEVLLRELPKALRLVYGKSKWQMSLTCTAGCAGVGCTASPAPAERNEALPSSRSIY
ncbi:hypothetical protein MTP99_002746 [Tenebrio molitor]|nr:hypothetical protein MTP99_002746 [Tenebrio molitor]